MIRAVSPLRRRDLALLAALAAAALAATALLLALGESYAEARGWLRLLLTLLVLVLLAKGCDIARGNVEARYRRLFETLAEHTGGHLETTPRRATRSRGLLGEATTTLLSLRWDQGGRPFQWRFVRDHKGRTTTNLFPVRIACRNPYRWSWSIRQDVSRSPFPDPNAPPTGDRRFDERYRVTAPREVAAALATGRVRARLLTLHPLLHMDLEGKPDGIVATLYHPTTDPYPYPYLFDLLTWLAAAQEGGGAGDDRP